MRKRHTYLSLVAEEYVTFNEFKESNEKWFAIMGVELCTNDKYLTLHIQLDCIEYEIYHVIPRDFGKLTISDIIRWQDNSCANSLLNIFTEEKADEEDILIYY